MTDTAAGASGSATPRAARGVTGDPSPDVAAAVFPGAGAMAARCRAFNWATTPLGPVADWPPSLRTAAGLVLGAGFPMILLWGRDLVQLYNDGYVPFLAAKHPGGLGRPTRDVWPEVWHLNQPIYARVFAGETVSLEAAHFPVRRQGADGPEEHLYVTLAYSPVPDDAGGIGGVLVTLRDVTAELEGRAAEAERVRLAAALAAERTTLLEEVFRRAPSFLHVLRGPDFVFELANAAYYQLVGHRDLLGRPAFEALPEAAGGGFPERLADVMATGTAFVGRELPVTLARTPGAPPEERLIDLVYLPLPDADGRGAQDACTRVLGHGTDVTEQVRARRAVEAERAHLLAEVAAERERLRALVLQMPAPVALLAGPELRYDLVNAAYQRISGGRDVTGLTHRDAFPELAGQGFYELFERVYWTGEPWGGPETPARYDRDGTGVADVWLDLRLEPVRDADGRVTGLLNFAVDVTDQVVARQEVEALLARSERARAEAEAERARADAERERAEAERERATQANRAKAEFLVVMSHELRTPLNAIGGYAQLIELGIHGPVTSEQLAALDRIQRGQHHLLGLINAVLNYAKLEAGHVEYHTEAVPACDALGEVVALVTPQARQNGLALVHGPCAPDLVAWADPEKVRQVLLNLLSNAVKFTGRGGTITVDGARAADGRIAVHVRDTGAGIAADQLARVFEPFVQVDQRLTRTQEGTGLGLAISRDLARGMGGDVTAESTPGAGSTLTLTLPAAPTAT